MGLFDLFTGKMPEDIENTGDDYFSNGSFGQAKIEYEKALGRHTKNPARDINFGDRITKKITRTREALAKQHRETGENLIEADCLKDAEELLYLALELTAEDKLKSEIEELLQHISTKRTASESEHFSETDYQSDYDEPDEAPASFNEEDEYFTVLCNTLPLEEQEAYPQYGQNFIKGYVALNQGGFELAAECLTLALEEHSNAKNLIPLELATCYLHLEEYEKAENLLNTFLNDFPDSERAYQLLCEIMWVLKKFKQAEQLLQSCPEEISNSISITLLKGETLFQAEKYKEAEAFYLDTIASNGQHEMIMRALGSTYEALGETEKARDLYAGLVNGCTSCGHKADEHLRQCFADTSFASGIRTTQLLEIYLDLIQEDPDNQADYFEKVSVIYASLGNENEARRFHAFAEKAAKE